MRPNFENAPRNMPGDFVFGRAPSIQLMDMGKGFGGRKRNRTAVDGFAVLSEVSIPAAFDRDGT